MSEPDLKVVQIHQSNFRDAAAALRAIADQIENGTMPDVQTVGVAIMSEGELIVCGCGPVCDSATIGMLFTASTRYMIEHMWPGLDADGS